MYAIREAEGVGGLLHVVAPVAALLLARVIEVDDAHHAVLLAVGVDVVAGNEGLACILYTANKVDDVLLLLLLALLAVGLVLDMLVVAHIVPIFFMHLNLYAWGRRVLDHKPLADAYQTVDVIPGILEDARVVGHGIVLVAGGGHP